jgi:nitric oxide reductase large subunit
MGAGIFGFLINLPIVSCFEVGTLLTAYHEHTAMMGVFGILAMVLTVFALRQGPTGGSAARLAAVLAGESPVSAMPSLAL